MKFHPYAEIFPLIEGAEFASLVEDIKSNGLREKIWLFDGKVIDGRNRFLACQKAKVRPQFRKFDGTDPLSFVVSANIHRRHLTESQRAMAAARIATARSGDNQHDGEVVPIGTASKMLNASPRSIKRAKKVIEKGSKDLVQAVDSGEVAVSKAASVVDLPKREQLAAATKPLEPKTADAILSQNWEPEGDEGERLASIEREQEASLQKWLDSDDKLASANTEIKRLAAEVAVLKISRDGYQNRCGEQARIIKTLRRKLEQLEKNAA